LQECIHPEFRIPSVPSTIRQSLALPAGIRRESAELKAGAAEKAATTKASFTRAAPEMGSDHNKLIMCYQCAKAIAHLHSRRPPVLHLDIKRNVSPTHSCVTFIAILM
jgi:hypothetical protein